MEVPYGLEKKGGRTRSGRENEGKELHMKLGGLAISGEASTEGGNRSGGRQVNGEGPKTVNMLHTASSCGTGRTKRRALPVMLV